MIMKEDTWSHVSVAVKRRMEQPEVVNGGTIVPLELVLFVIVIFWKILPFRRGFQFRNLLENKKKLQRLRYSLAIIRIATGPAYKGATNNKI